MAASSSSVPLFGIREEDQNQMKPQHSSSTPTSSSAPTALPQQKKKRNQPGTPNPDAEVIALSPKTLMATNRFICEVCNKGFQREQNLQLHRRGHNLPWKLKQKTTKEVKRKVYLCPEPTCVHHDPSRALGDLTGIKKHFSRKHGEKKWKCDKCSKRYAVQSDWKAHSKTCGTREYRCDCGTLFSRRDSFITHRAFCDALAQESARNPPANMNMNSIGRELYGSSSNVGLGLAQAGAHQISSLQEHPSNDILRLGRHGTAGRDRSTSTTTGQYDHLLPPSSSFRPPTHVHHSSISASAAAGFFMQDQSSNINYHEEVDHHLQSTSTSSSSTLFQNKPFHQGLMQFADLHNTSSSTSTSTTSSTNHQPAVQNLFNLSSFLSAGNIMNNINAANNNNNIGGGGGGGGGGVASSSSGFLIPNHHQYNNVQLQSGSGSGDDGSNLFSSKYMIMGTDHHHHHHQIPNSSIFSSSSVQNDQDNINNMVLAPAAHMSATALLQKAAQMGSSTSTNSNNNNSTTSSSTASLLIRSLGSSTSSSTGLISTKSDHRPPPVVSTTRHHVTANFGSVFGETIVHHSNNLHEVLINSFAPAAAAGNSSNNNNNVNIFGSQENPYPTTGYSSSGNNLQQDKQHHSPNNYGNMDDHSKLHQNLNVTIGGSDRLTRDFLGVGQIVRSMSGAGAGFSNREKQQQPPPPPVPPPPQHGMDMSPSSLDSDRNVAASTTQSFGGNTRFQ